MQLSIDSLAVYSTMCKYFLVVAPAAVHESEVECSLETYERRGWCRLEQWARMSTGQHGMFITTGSAIRPFTDCSMQAALRVYEGDFTVPDDRAKLRLTALGLWARIVQATDDAISADLRPMRRYIEDNMDTIFPTEHFGDLPNRVVDHLVKLNATSGENVFRASIQSSLQSKSSLRNISITRQPKQRKISLDLVARALTKVEAGGHSTADQVGGGNQSGLRVVTEADLHVPPQPQSAPAQGPRNAQLRWLVTMAGASTADLEQHCTGCPSTSSHDTESHHGRNSTSGNDGNESPGPTATESAHVWNDGRV